MQLPHYMLLITSYDYATVGIELVAGAKCVPDRVRDRTKDRRTVRNRKIVAAQARRSDKDQAA